VILLIGYLLGSSQRMVDLKQSRRSTVGPASAIAFIDNWQFLIVCPFRDSPFGDYESLDNGFEFAEIKSDPFHGIDITDQKSNINCCD
jgi:hypothetical protein